LSDLSKIYSKQDEELGLKTAVSPSLVFQELRIYCREDSQLHDPNLDRLPTAVSED
jgi:hypothetical protein